MKAVYEVKENCKAELTVTVDGQQWEDAKKKAFKKLAANVEIKGFRKGKAPLSAVKRIVTDEYVNSEAMQEYADAAFQYGLAENEGINLIDRPEITDVQGLSNEGVTYVFGLTIAPTVTLGDYKACEYKPARVTVTKKAVDEEIEKLQKKNSVEELKEEGTVEMGDIAVIDFEGFVDGVAFEGGKGTEYPLEIGSGSFIPGFEEQIVGMATNEEKDVNVTFPTEYAPELAGKDATFKVKVCGIKVKKLPELNDEFVEDLNMEGVKTVDDLTKHLKAQIKEQKTAQAEEEATNALLDAICEACPVEIPAVMVEREVEDTYQNYEQRFAQQGIGMDMYLQITGSTKEAFMEQLKPECEKKVRVRLVLEAIGNDMAVEVSEAELDEEFNKMAEQYAMSVEEIKKIVPSNYLTDDVKMRKTLEALKGNKGE